MWQQVMYNHHLLFSQNWFIIILLHIFTQKHTGQVCSFDRIWNNDKWAKSFFFFVKHKERRVLCQCFWALFPSPALSLSIILSRAVKDSQVRKAQQLPAGFCSLPWSREFSSLGRLREWVSEWVKTPAGELPAAKNVSLTATENSPGITTSNKQKQVRMRQS